MHSGVQEPLCFRLRAIVARDAMPGIKQAFDHAAPHCTQANVTKICHRKPPHTK